MAKVLSRRRVLSRRVRTLSRKITRRVRKFVKTFFSNPIFSATRGGEEQTMNIRSILSWAAALLFTLTLAACGGGGGETTAVYQPFGALELSAKKCVAAVGQSSCTIEAAITSSGVDAQGLNLVPPTGAPVKVPGNTEGLKKALSVPVGTKDGEVRLVDIATGQKLAAEMVTAECDLGTEVDANGVCQTVVVTPPASAKGFVGLASQVVGDHPLGVFVVKGDTCAAATFQWAENATTYNVGAPFPLGIIWVYNTQTAPGKVLLSGNDGATRRGMELDILLGKLTDTGEMPDEAASGWETSATPKAEHQDPEVGNYAVGTADMTVFVKRSQPSAVYCRDAAGDRLVYDGSAEIGLVFKYFRYFGM